MDGRRVSELTRLPDAVPRLRREPRPLPRSWAAAVGAGWPLLLVVMTAVAPEPADPNAVPTFVDSAVFLVVMVGLFGTIVAAVARQSKALVWSTGLGLFGWRQQSPARSRATTTPWAGSGTPSWRPVAVCFCSASPASAYYCALA